MHINTDNISNSNSHHTANNNRDHGGHGRRPHRPALVLNMGI